MPRKVGTEYYSRWSIKNVKNVCKIVFLRPTGSSCRHCGKDYSTCCFFSLPQHNRFLGVWPPTFFSAVLNFFLPLTASGIWGAANFNKSAVMRFAAGSTYLRKKWNWGSHKNLCQCTEPPFTLSTNTSAEWNLFLLWRNHLAMFPGLIECERLF